VSEVRIPAEPRTEFGKGAARRIRRAHRVPAVIYGHGAQTRHVSLPGHELMLALKTSNVLIELELDGDRQLVLPKEIQRDPVRRVLEHVDLVVVNRGEKVVVEVPVHVTGQPAGGALVNVDASTLTVEAEATHIPQAIEVSVEGVAAGTHITAADVALPPGTTLATDAETLILGVTAAPTAEQVDAELASAEADAGIVHEEKSAEPAATGALS
jgi:large subunit ribosomal protein L25